ncbi:hypothetical protein VSK91_03845 [Bacillus swezeyi]|uniref:hypothetical protein n=1 Tax=Bacillus swezeyi TaxID=1925020 RepID=UPI0039C75258
MKKNKVKKVLRINIANPQQEKPHNFSTKNLQANIMEEAINNSNLESATSDKSVILNWEKLPDKDGVYEIYKDDQKIAETTNLTFKDNEVTPGEEYKYSIKIQIDRDQIESQKISKKIKEKKVELTEEEKNEIYSINGELSTIIQIPNNAEGELNKSEKIFNRVKSDQYSTKSLPKENAYSFVYRTFIPYKSVKDPNPIRKGYLKGDNRSFATLSDKFRTEADMHVQFSSPNSAHLYKKVGRSHRCSDADCKKIIQSATASSSGIEKSVDMLTSSRIRWTVRHGVGIPFGSEYPDIDYQYFADLTKYKVTLSGTHDGAPNHEFYILTPSGSRFVHSHSVKNKDDFWKLLGLGMGNFWKMTI